MRYLIATAVLSLAGSAMAETWTVDDDGKADFDNIQAAINAASDGDEIIVAPGTYTYTPGSGDDVVDTLGKAIYLHSSSGLEKTILDGEGTRGVVRCISGETAETVIEGFTITGGHYYAGAGIHFGSSSPTLINCLITGNVGEQGGGIQIDDCSPTLTNCTISGNTTGESTYAVGGGIFMWFSFPTLTNCVISDNTCEAWEWWSPNAGGIYSQFSNPTLIDTTVCGNNRDQICGKWTDGGNTCVAISCDDGDGDGVPDTCQGTNGDRIHEVPSEYPTVQAAIDVATDGDLVLVSPGTYTGAATADSVINPRGKRISIRSSEGAGVTILDGENVRRVVRCTSGETAETVIQGFTMTGGRSDQGGADWDGAPGGGVLCRWSDLTLVDCTISGNTSMATGCGGGVGLVWDSHITMTGCTISNNSAWFGGGLICFEECSFKLTNCTISDNDQYMGINQILQRGTVGEMNGCTISGSAWGMEDPSIRLERATWAGGPISHLTLTDCTILDGAVAVGEGTILSFAGTSTCESILLWPASTLAFAAESVCAVPADLMPSSGAVTTFDLDNLDTSASLLAGGEMVRQGCLGVTNETGSLAEAEVGMILPLAQTDELGGEFDSIVFPQMPDGLGLQIVTQSTIRGGGSQIALEVIEVEGAQFDDPFSGGLDSAPIDIIEFDADGDGADEIAVLFAGTPGVVAAFQVSEDGAPTPIEGLAAYVGNNPVDLDAGDLNGDGLGDLIVANGDDSTLSVLQTQEDIVDGSLYFDVSTVTVPDAGQALTCVTVMDWDGGTALDAVVGVDIADPNTEDGYQVLLDVAATNSSGPWFAIPNYVIPGFDSVSDPPTCVDGGEQTSAWGFVGGTRYGRVHRAIPSGPLQAIDELDGKNIVTIEAVHMDGDGQLDIMAASDETESIYLLPGDAAEPDDFGDLIPIAVSEPVEDVVVLDADDDGDMDMIMTAPGSDADPLLLLRNDGPAGGGLLQSLGGNVWSKQSMANAQPPHLLASGALNNKDDDDDWVIGGGGGLGFGDETGVLEQTNLLGDTGGCPEDIDGNGTVNIDDLLLVLGNYNGTGEGDVDGNGVVNIDDMLLVIGAWNAEC